MEFYQLSIEILIDYIRTGASVIWNDTRAAKGSLVCLTAKLHLYVMQMNEQCKQIFLQKQKQKKIQIKEDNIYLKFSSKGKVTNNSRPDYSCISSKELDI